jgi:hypothetical protein
LGANFFFFFIANQGYTQTGSSALLSALIMQLEFPRINFWNNTLFRTFSIFSEGQLWFIPSDVDADLGVPDIMHKLTIGARVYIF